MRLSQLNSRSLRLDSNNYQMSYFLLPARKLSALKLSSAVTHSRSLIRRNSAYMKHLSTSSTNPRRALYCDIEDAEPLTRYRQGGYHPTHIGDVLKDGRYKITHKLGWGGYATVWLAEDQVYAVT